MRQAARSFSRALLMKRNVIPALKKGILPISLLTTYQYLSQKTIRQDDSEQLVSIQVDSSSLEEGQMIEVKVGPKDDDNVLLSRVDNTLHCVSNKCTHFGAPLAKGLLVEDRVLCPWHAAAFSVKTGAPEYGPVLDGLQVFQVTEKDGIALIQVDLKKLNKKKTMDMSNKGDDNRRFVIVGGGPAGLSCAETLRQSGFEGEIVIFGDEPYVPYDRTLLTKLVSGTDINKIQLRGEDFLTKYDITLEKGVKVSMIDYDNKHLFTADGRKVQYQQVLVATGGSPVVPKMTGSNLENVLVYRSMDDLKKVQRIINKDSKVVIIGSSFIGMEAASGIKKDIQAEQVTIVGLESSPFERVLGVQVGDSLRRLSESKGIEFQMNSSVQLIKGEEETGKVTGVQLTDGRLLEADVVIMGCGIKPNTSLFPSNAIDTNGGVKADVFLKSIYDSCYVAGDMASVPYSYTGQQVRVEHYNDAILQGQVAAFNMLGKSVPLQLLPFFYTRLHDKSLAYAGYAKDFDQVIIDGDLNTHKFLALYAKNDRIMAAAGMQRNGDLLMIQEAMKQNLLPKASQLESNEVSLDNIRASLKKTKCGRCQRVDNCHSKKN